MVGDIVLDPNDVLKGSKVFRARLKDPMYKVATFLIEHFWGDPRDMADGLGVLLLTWNQAFYRYGGLDFDALKQALSKSMVALARYRARDILSFTETDVPAVEKVFDDFLDALKIADDKSQRNGARSPVAVAKALHLLAPRFFPLWDKKIAKGYHCGYAKDPVASYLRFMWIIKDNAGRLQGAVGVSGYGILKIIDEYNFARFTQSWI